MINQSNREQNYKFNNNTFINYFIYFILLLISIFCLVFFKRQFISNSLIESFFKKSHLKQIIREDYSSLASDNGICINNTFNPLLLNRIEEINKKINEIYKITKYKEEFYFISDSFHSFDDCSFELDILNNEELLKDEKFAILFGENYDIDKLITIEELNKLFEEKEEAESLVKKNNEYNIDLNLKYKYSKTLADIIKEELKNLYFESPLGKMLAVDSEKIKQSKLLLDTFKPFLHKYKSINFLSEQRTNNPLSVEQIRIFSQRLKYTAELLDEIEALNEQYSQCDFIIAVLNNSKKTIDLDRTINVHYKHIYKLIIDRMILRVETKKDEISEVLAVKTSQFDDFIKVNAEIKEAFLNEIQMISKILNNKIYNFFFNFMQSIDYASNSKGKYNPKKIDRKFFNFCFSEIVRLKEIYFELLDVQLDDEIEIEKTIKESDKRQTDELIDFIRDIYDNKEEQYFLSILKKKSYLDSDIQNMISLQICADSSLVSENEIAIKSNVYIPSSFLNKMNLSFIENNYLFDKIHREKHFFSPEQRKEFISLFDFLTISESDEVTLKPEFQNDSIKIEQLKHVLYILDLADGKYFNKKILNDIDDSLVITKFKKFLVINIIRDKLSEHIISEYKDVLFPYAHFAYNHTIIFFNNTVLIKKNKTNSCITPYNNSKSYDKFYPFEILPFSSLNRFERYLDSRLINTNDFFKIYTKQNDTYINSDEKNRFNHSQTALETLVDFHKYIINRSNIELFENEENNKIQPYIMDNMEFFLKYHKPFMDVIVNFQRDIQNNQNHDSVLTQDFFNNIYSLAIYEKTRIIKINSILHQINEITTLLEKCEQSLESSNNEYIKKMLEDISLSISSLKESIDICKNEELSLEEHISTVNKKTENLNNILEEINKISYALSKLDDSSSNSLDLELQKSSNYDIINTEKLELNSQEIVNINKLADLVVELEQKTLSLLEIVKNNILDDKIDIIKKKVYKYKY